MRVRPVNDHEREGGVTVGKVSSNSLSVGDRKFTFDSVLDSNSNQVQDSLCVFFYNLRTTSFKIHCLY